VQSLYTGVYGKGGPTNVDMDPDNLASLCDRSSADVRGVKNGACQERCKQQCCASTVACRVEHRCLHEAATCVAHPPSLNRCRWP
jgi:hypothetical protein